MSKRRIKNKDVVLKFGILQRDFQQLKNREAILKQSEALVNCSIGKKQFKSCTEIKLPHIRMQHKLS